MRKRFFAGCLLAAVIWSVLPVGQLLADTYKAVSLGNDITQSQRQEMLDLFGVNEQTAKIVTITNEDERQYLKGIAPESQIGIKAISCSYVEPLSKDAGLDISVKNLAWVTKEMIATSLTTAGIKDVKVVAAAPFQVSGTAALTGIIKGFEQATGKKIDPKASEAANKEMVTTGQIGDQVGKDKAVKMMNDIKNEVVQNKIKSPDDIRTIIEKVAKHYDVNLSEEQINKIIDVMTRIGQLNLNPAEISKQLKDINDKLSNIINQNAEAKNVLDKILLALQDMLRRIGEWMSGLGKG